MLSRAQIASRLDSVALFRPWPPAPRHRCFERT